MWFFYVIYTSTSSNCWYGVLKESGSTVVVFIGSGIGCSFCWLLFFSVSLNLSSKYLSTNGPSKSSGKLGFEGIIYLYKRSLST